MLKMMGLFAHEVGNHEMYAHEQFLNRKRWNNESTFSQHKWSAFPAGDPGRMWRKIKQYRNEHGGKSHAFGYDGNNNQEYYDDDHSRYRNRV